MTETETRPSEPSELVASELLWRLATRLYHEHRCDEHGVDGERCAACGQPWPCSGRRLAELGLNRATG